MQHAIHIRDELILDAHRNADALHILLRRAGEPDAVRDEMVRGSRSRVPQLLVFDGVDPDRTLRERHPRRQNGPVVVGPEGGK